MNISNDILVFIYLYPVSLLASMYVCSIKSITLHYGYTKNEIPVIGHLF